MNHKIRIIQTFNATREIVVEVDDLGDNDPASALERVQSGDFDTPDFDDPRWESFWDLQSEKAELA